MSDMKFKLRRAALGIFLGTGLAASSVAVVLTVSAKQAPVEQLNIQESCHQLTGEAFARTELLFGLSKPDRSVITEAEFQHFVDRQVTPLFPDGLTVLSAAGQFKAPNQAVVKEKSKLLMLVYPLNHKHHNSIEQIRTVYKQMFRQQSVLRVDDLSCVSF